MSFSRIFLLLGIATILSVVLPFSDDDYQRYKIEEENTSVLEDLDEFDDEDIQLSSDARLKDPEHVRRGPGHCYRVPRKRCVIFFQRLVCYTFRKRKCW